MKKSIEIIRLARGYVSFSAYGGFPDRFFAACRDSGVNLWNIRNVNGTIFADTLIEDYRKMPKVRNKSDMSVRIVEKRGLPFVVYKRRNRIGLLFGLLILIALVFLMSNCIWTISVDGNKEIDENDILRAFRENGVRIGASVKGINITDAETSVYTAFPSLSWVSLNTSGGVAKVLVREGEKIPEIDDEKPPCNIVANYGGQIETYEVYEGTAEQELNAAVSKGDLLISGILTYADGTTVLRHAAGKVIAKTSREVVSTCDDKFDIFAVSDTYDMYIINFFWFKIPVYNLKALRCKEELYPLDYEEYIELNGVITPVGLTKRILYTKERAAAPDSRKMSVCLDDFFRKQRTVVGDSEIRKEKLKVTNKENGVNILCNFDLAENICGSQEILYTN